MQWWPLRRDEHHHLRELNHLRELTGARLAPQQLTPYAHLSDGVSMHASGWFFASALLVVIGDEAVEQTHAPA